MSLLGWLSLPLRVRLRKPDDDHDARRLRDALKSRRFSVVEEALASATDPHDRFFFIEALSSWKKRPEYLVEWAEASPDCAAAFAVRGSHGIDWAWEARGGGINVKDSDLDLFDGRLVNAWEDLQRAAELMPDDATPYARMITCAIGLGIEHERTINCFHLASERCHDLWEPHVAMLSYLCEKWHGSHQEMFDFARGVGSQAPEGSGLHALICKAHFERWLYAQNFENNKVLADNYWGHADVRNEILGAYHMSIGSPNHTPTRASEEQRNWFAMALANIGARKEALAEFKRIGNRPAVMPWDIWMFSRIAFYDAYLTAKKSR